MLKDKTASYILNDLKSLACIIFTIDNVITNVRAVWRADRVDERHRPRGFRRRACVIQSFDQPGGNRVWRGLENVVFRRRSRELSLWSVVFVATRSPLVHLVTDITPRKQLSLF
jgi:hypothetical protein